MILPEGRVEVALKREDEHALTDLSIDVGEERDCFHAGNLTHLVEEFVSSLRDEILAEPFDHFYAVRRFRQLPLRRREDAFQADHDHVPDDKGSDVVRPSSHELLLKLDNGVPNRAFDFALTPFLVINHWLRITVRAAARDLDGAVR